LDIDNLPNGIVMHAPEDRASSSAARLSIAWLLCSEHFGQLEMDDWSTCEDD
jgi:hypothetical protein